MYEIIRQIINHTWATSGATGDQQYIYYISGALILVLVPVIIDLVYRIFGSFWRR